MVFNLLDKPALTLQEACMIIGLSQSSIKRRLSEGVLKQVDRMNKRQKILITTASVKKYLNIGGFVAIFGLYRKLGQKINPIVDIFLPLV